MASPQVAGAGGADARGASRAPRRELDPADQADRRATAARYGDGIGWGIDQGRRTRSRRRPGHATSDSAEVSRRSADGAPADRRQAQARRAPTAPATRSSRPPG